MDRYDLIGLIIAIVLQYGALFIFYPEWSIKTDTLYTIWIFGVYHFNYGIPYIYRSFKGNYWNLSIAKTQPAFKYYTVSVIMVLISFPIIMPFDFIVDWLTCSVTVQIILFFYDLIVNGKH